MSHSEDFEINIFNNAEVKLMKEFTPDELIRYFPEPREMMSDWENQVSTDELEITGSSSSDGGSNARRNDKNGVTTQHNSSTRH